jgi:SecD/SecF fusion protein
VLASLFSALVLSRVITEWVVRRGAVRRRPRVSDIASIGPMRRRFEAANPDLLRRHRRWLGVSAAVCWLHWWGSSRAGWSSALSSPAVG